MEKHYREFLSGMERLKDLADSSAEEDDRKFAKWLKVAEKHWAVCAAYMPKPKPDESDREPDENSVSNVHNVIERLIGERVQRSSALPVQNGSVVPTPLRPQKGGHGDAGSES